MMRSSLFIVNFLILTSAFTKPALSVENKVEPSLRVISLTSFSADITNKISPGSLVAIPGSKLLDQDPNMKNLPRISSGRNQPSLERIISLRPDLVIGATGFHDKVLRKLKNLGVATINYKISNFNSIQSLSNQISSYLSLPSVPVNSYMPSCFVSSSLKKENIDPLLVVVSFKPIIAPTSTSWSGSLLRHLKIPNLTASLPGSSQFSGYATLSPEWVIKTNPKSLAIIAFSNSDIPNLSEKPIWKNISAVKSKKVNLFNYYGLINPGSLDSINKTCRKLLSI